MQVVSIMIKRGWFEDPPDFFSGFADSLEKLLNDPATRTVNKEFYLSAG